MKPIDICRLRAQGERYDAERTAFGPEAVLALVCFDYIEEQSLALMDKIYLN